MIFFIDLVCLTCDFFAAEYSTFFIHQVNEKTSSLRAGNLTEAQTIQTLAQQRWPNTFRLDCTVLGQPIGRVTRQLTWEQYLGRPMEQPVPGMIACLPCPHLRIRIQIDTLPFRDLL